MINDGGKPYSDEIFSNSYQNDQQDGKKNFLMLWLHAYKYTVPEFMANDGQEGDEEQDLVIKTEKPVWVKEEYEFKQWREDGEKKSPVI